MEKRHHLIGLDLGGLTVNAGVVDLNGNIQSFLTLDLPSVSDRTSQTILSLVLKAASDAVSEAKLSLTDDILGIGIGCPGIHDYSAGTVVEAANLPELDGFGLARELSYVIGKPCVLENDANAATLAEAWIRSLKQQSTGGPELANLSMLTLGTGVGSGFIVDGQILHGRGMAGEFGHSILYVNGKKCGCGQEGCVERYISATAVVALAKEQLDTLIEDHDDNRCDHQVVKTSILNSTPQDKITAKLVFTSASKGDQLCQQIVNQVINHIGVTCVNVARTFDPQLIVLTGGLTNAGAPFFEAINRAFKKNTWKLKYGEVEIVPSIVGNKAGMLGAAAAVLAKYRANKLHHYRYGRSML